MTTTFGTGLRRAAARLHPDPAPDGELLARFLASRDEAAFALLVRRHGSMVLGVCRRVLGNAADADDAFQAAFIVLVRKAHSLTDRACVGNFLYGVASLTALKARAMATKRRAKEAKASRNPERPESDELTRVLDEELAKLPDKYREPVVLCELEGVSRKDAAARLAIPEGTISSRLATAHRMLSKRLTAKGFAAVAVSAVLGNQAAAVPDALADMALRSAVDGPPAAVTRLASEVSKMLLVNKLTAGAVLAGLVLAVAAGGGLVARGFAADDKPAVKAPAAKPKPDSSYTLQDGEVLKLIPAPFPEQRKQVLKATDDGGNREGGIAREDKRYVFSVDAQKGWKEWRSYGSARPVGNGKLVADSAVELEYFLKMALGLERQELRGLHFLDDHPAVSRVKLDADVVLRPGAKPEQLAAAMQAELKAKCDLDVVLTYTEEERECVVLTGKFRRPDEAGVPKVTIDLFATTRLPQAPLVTASDGSQLANVLSDLLGEPVFDTSDIATHTMQVTYRSHLRLPSTAKTLAEDRDRAKVLKNLQEQTGLGYVLEKRKVKSLTVKANDPKAKPAEKKQEADKTYSLKDGEVLKLIAAPFSDDRKNVFRRVNRDRTPAGKPADYRMIIPADGVELRQCFLSSSGETGWPLGFALASLLDLQEAEIIADSKLLALPFDADALVRPDTPADKLLPALQAELKAECGIDVTLEFKELEREVIVASGTYLPRAGPNQIEPRHEYDLFADAKLDMPSSSSFGFTQAFLPFIGKYVNRPVVDQTNLKALPSIYFGLHEHDRTPATEKTRAEDRDPAKVLKNLEDQTGLTFKLGMRKVKSLVVTKTK